MEHTRDEFNQLATATFGDKVIVRGISVTDERLAEINETLHEAHKKAQIPHKFIPYKKEDIENYPHYAWAANGECPVCGATLGGLLGAFRWGMIHGEGFCAQCRQAEHDTYFRFYHYITEGADPLHAFALIGFPDPDATEPEEEEEDDWLNDGLDDAIIGDH